MAYLWRSLDAFPSQALVLQLSCHPHWCPDKQQGADSTCIINNEHVMRTVMSSVILSLNTLNMMPVSFAKEESEENVHHYYMVVLD